MSAVASSALRIATPEGVVFSHKLATPTSRCLAWAVDATAITGVSFFLSRLCAVAGFFSVDIANFLTTVLYFVASVAYGMILEWRWRGQTLGKRLFGLRVIDAQGLRLSQCLDLKAELDALPRSRGKPLDEGSDLKRGPDVPASCIPAVRSRW